MYNFQKTLKVETLFGMVTISYVPDYVEPCWSEVFGGESKEPITGYIAKFPDNHERFAGLEGFGLNRSTAIKSLLVQVAGHIAEYDFSETHLITLSL